MTAPDRPTWTVAEDPAGDLTLWYGDTAVLRRFVLGGAFAPHADLLWQVLTRVLAPDEAAIERLAWVVKPEDERCSACEESCSGCADDTAESVRRTLAALADTSAQARHTTDDAPMECAQCGATTGLTVSGGRAWCSRHRGRPRDATGGA